MNSLRSLWLKIKKSPPQSPLSKTTILKAVHKYICIYLYLCTKTINPFFKNHKARLLPFCKGCKGRNCKILRFFDFFNTLQNTRALKKSKAVYVKPQESMVSHPTKWQKSSKALFQKPQSPLSKTMILKAVHKYICIYLYLCTKTPLPNPHPAQIARWWSCECELCFVHRDDNKHGALSSEQRQGS